MLHTLSFEILLHKFCWRQHLLFHWLNLRLIWLQILSVLSTSIEIAPPLFSKLLRPPILIVRSGFRAITRRQMALRVLALLNVLLWVNTKLCTRKVPQRPSRRLAFWPSRKTNNSFPFWLNLGLWFWGNHECREWSKSDHFTPVLWFDSLCYLVSLEVQCHCGLKQGMKMPSVRAFFPSRKSWSSGPLWVTQMLQTTNIGYFWKLFTNCGIAPVIGTRRLTQLCVLLVLPECTWPLLIHRVCVWPLWSFCIPFGCSFLFGSLCWQLCLCLGGSQCWGTVWTSFKGMSESWLYKFSWAVPCYSFFMTFHIFVG